MLGKRKESTVKGTAIIGNIQLLAILVRPVWSYPCWGILPFDRHEHIAPEEERQPPRKGNWEGLKRGSEVIKSPVGGVDQGISIGNVERHCPGGAVGAKCGGAVTENCGRTVVSTSRGIGRAEGNT